jgi:hypothetical protein
MDRVLRAGGGVVADVRRPGRARALGHGPTAMSSQSSAAGAVQAKLAPQRARFVLAKKCALVAGAFVRVKEAWDARGLPPQARRLGQRSRGAPGRPAGLTPYRTPHAARAQGRAALLPAPRAFRPSRPRVRLEGAAGRLAAPPLPPVAPPVPAAGAAASSRSRRSCPSRPARRLLRRAVGRSCRSAPRSSRPAARARSRAAASSRRAARAVHPAPAASLRRRPPAEPSLAGPLSGVFSLAGAGAARLTITEQGACRFSRHQCIAIWYGPSSRRDVLMRLWLRYAGNSTVALAALSTGA